MSIPSNEGTPDASPERLIGREFSDLRLGRVLRVGRRDTVTLHWMPVEADIEGNVAVVSGTITGVDYARSSELTLFAFDRTDLRPPRPDASVTVENYVAVPDDDVSGFAASLS